MSVYVYRNIKRKDFNIVCSSIWRSEFHFAILLTKMSWNTASVSATRVFFKSLIIFRRNAIKWQFRCVKIQNKNKY